MKKNGYNASTSFQKTKNTSNIQFSRQETEFKDFEIDSDFFEDFRPYQSKDISQSAKHPYDEDKGKIIAKSRELSKKKNFSEQYFKLNPKGKEKDRINRISYNSNHKNETEKQNDFSSSPDFKIGSPIHRKDSNDIEEMGVKTNYVFESKKINGKNAGTYSVNERYEYINRKGKKESKYQKSNECSPGITDIISPERNKENSTDGENEDNHIKSFDNYQYSVGTNNTNKYRYNKNKILKKEKNNLNYELEDPERFDNLNNNQRNVSNDEVKNNSRFINRSLIRNKINESVRSDLKDFQSPDRNIDETKKFRKVNMEMLTSKGPSNDDRKVTKIITKEIIETKNMDKNVTTNKNEYYSEDKKVREDAAKIIQDWWRNNYKKEEADEIAIQSAVKLQSFMRGFLVRKKVLRYITLAIYYQSFCDKLQDVLCNYVKKEIFKLFKEEFLYKKKKRNVKKVRISREIINKRKKKIFNLFKKKTKKYVLYYLRKWKERAFRIKIKNKTKEAYKYKVKTKTNIKDYNVKVTHNEHRNKKDIKTSTIQQTTVQPRTNNYSNYSYNYDYNNNYYQTKTYNATKKRTTINECPVHGKNICPVHGRKRNVRLYHRPIFSPYIYTSTTETKKRSGYYSPDVYSRKTYNNDSYYDNYENSYYSNYESKCDNSYISNYNYSNNLNKSYDAGFYRKNLEKIKYTTTDERRNHKTFNRVEISKEKEKERNTSPQFGTLRKSDKNKNINNQTNQLNHTTIKFVDRRKNTNTNTNINNVDNTRRTKKLIKNINVKKTEVKNIKNVKNIDIKRRSKNTNDILNTPNLLKTNISKETTTLSESENIYYQRKEKRSRSRDRYSFYSKYNNLAVNAIDNQLSLSIIKLPDDDKLNRTEIKDDIPEKIKIKEKIIIQKEMEPETAEEGNNFQIFDMNICRRVSLFIKATTELGKKITDESESLEVMKKRERERSQEIDNYKKDIANRKLKSLLDTLRHSIRIAEGFKKRILYKKFNQYRKNASIKSFVLEIEPMDEFEINKIIKEKKDFAVQMGSSPGKKAIKSFKLLKISEIPSVSYLFKKKEKPQKITNTKLNILSKIKKVDQGQQSESWNTQITNVKYDDINLTYSNPIYPKTENIIGATKQIEIIRTKPTMVDDEVQHEYEDNEIEAESLEFIHMPKIFKDSTSQYDQYKPKITKGDNLIIKQFKEKIETKDAECNAIINTVEEGINAIEEVKPKPKNIEIQLRTVKRSIAKMEIPILKKIWLRKAFKTFRDNCNRPPFHLIIERELLRMAFLRWRFIKGYGPDRYGNVYDRDGNLLYKTKGKVSDVEIQNDQIIEQDEQGTQYIPIENIITTLKQLEFGPSYKKPEKKITKDVSVGNNIEMEEAIESMDSFDIKQKKKKKVLKRMTNDNFGIIIKKKKYKNQETQMPRVDNIIEKNLNMKISNEQYILNKRNNARLKDLLTQLVYRRIITDKLDLSEALRNWLKQTILLMHIEQYEIEEERRKFAKIKKNDRFSLIEKISKEDSGTQVIIPKNKVESNINLNLIKNIIKKNAEIYVNLPSQFDLEKIEPKKENKFLVKSSKPPVILKTQKETGMNIFSDDYIFNEEVKRGIHHEMTEKAKKRVTEIFLKFFNSRGDPISLLRKYLTIWYRKVNYLSLLDNARIISEFCKRNLNKLFNYRKWRKLSEKLLLKEKIEIIKLSKHITIRINKIFDLIRLTRVNTVFSKRKYLHFIIIAWLAYTRTIIQKRTHVKSLYENMINTYMNIADDIFGNNQKENPSVQDAIFEAVDSDKFQTKDVPDVPIANKYYEKKKEITKITKNITTYDNKNKDNDTNNKEYTIYKSTVSSYPISSSNKKNENKEKIIEVKDEERLHSRGRGRAYRTEYEKNVINKLYNTNKINLFNESKRDEESMDYKEIRRSKGNKSVTTESNTETYNDLNENKFNDKKERKKMSYVERRKLFRSKFEENEK